MSDDEAEVIAPELPDVPEEEVLEAERMPKRKEIPEEERKRRREQLAINRAKGLETRRKKALAKKIANQNKYNEVEETIKKKVIQENKGKYIELNEDEDIENMRKELAELRQFKKEKKVVEKVVKEPEKVVERPTTNLNLNNNDRPTTNFIPTPTPKAKPKHFPNSFFSI
tara:strand:- start:165 stop:674 length:510 start_codon:yes stop_codon:yes gene_type:complete